MADEVDKFVISVQLQADQLKQQLAGLNQTIAKFGENTKKQFVKGFNPKDFKANTTKIEAIVSNSTKNIAEILTNGLAGIGSVLGVKFATDFIGSVTSSGLGIKTVSTAIGVSYKQLQQFQNLFSRQGGTPEAASGALASLNAQVTNANGAPQLAAVLANLGVDSRGKNTGDLFKEILLKASDISNPILRNSLLRQAGFNQSEVLSLASLGRKNLEKELAKSEKYVRSDKLIDQEARQAQNIGQVKQGLSVLGAEGLGWISDLPSKWAKLGDKIRTFFPKSLKEDTNSFDYKYERMWSSSIRKKLIEIESSGGTDTTDRIYKGNDPRRGYGIFQVTKGAAQDILGKHVDWEKVKKDSALQEIVAKGYFKKGLVKAHGDFNGARAFYNGGERGLKRYLSSGVGSSAYDQLKWQKINGLGSESSMNQTVSININSVNLPNVQNPMQFAREMQQMSTTPYAFSGNILA